MAFGNPDTGATVLATVLWAGFGDRGASAKRRVAAERLKP